jgi:hypothetical protein
MGWGKGCGLRTNDPWRRWVHGFHQGRDGLGESMFLEEKIELGRRWAHGMMLYP